MGAPGTNNPPWYEPVVPPREECVLKHMLDARARRHPERRVALFEDGSSWTYGECRQQVRAAAAALQQLGVRKGDRVLAWLPTGMPLVLTWFAANYLGAVFVPLNTAYRGKVLEHVVNNARAAVMVAHPELVERLTGLELPHLKEIIEPGALQGGASELDDSAEIDHWDIQCIIYTSGTTGPSKGVLSPYLQLYTTAVVNYGYLHDGEAILINLPLFHVGGTSPTYCALVRSGSFYLVDGFSTTKFWEQVRTGNCATTSGLVGVMSAFLAKSEPRPDDHDNPLRCITMMPINELAFQISERFGFDYVTGFNMTEISTPLIAGLNSRVFGGCGRPRTGATCRLVDEHDVEVPVGAPGELIVRTDLPWSMNAGYDGMPEATATAWRNGWFHTGDLFRRDADDNYFFLDRIKDTIRRRGENISSFEVETAVRGFEDVDEVVAVAVASEIEEQEVLVVVTAKPGRSIEPRALIEYLVPRLAYFMIPRYVRVVAEIPKTETNKPRKVVFRDAGITPDCWDRERAGITLRRERL
jgi:crotonobetaine/carnitine-CoA ligase